MPIYEYQCLDCNANFDSIRNIKDADTPIKCNKCHSDHTQRKLSVFFANSGGKSIAGNSSGCAGCGGGSCSSCGGH